MNPLLLALPFFFLATLPGFAQEAPPSLTVRGEARIEVPADQGQLTLAVVTTAATAAAALRQNSEKLRGVEKALVQAGLETGEYRTGQFSIHPEWSPRPDQAAPTWQPTIVGYTVNNSLHVTTGKLSLLGTLIEAGVKAGANQVEGLAFDLADAAPFRARTIGQAAANARTDALALANAAGVRLGAVLSLQLDPAESAPRPMMLRMAEAASPPITPGEVSVRAGVTIVYRIEQ